MSTKKLWKKIIAVALAVLLAFSSVPVSYTVDTYAATATKLYLKPNSEWLVDGARFAAYFFGNGDKWVSMTGPDSSGYYQVSVPSGYPSVIFCRMNGGTTENNWNNKWNQTADLTIPTSGECCWTLNSGDWGGGGAWSHQWNSGSVTTAATCTAAGTKTYTCTLCSATKTETIAKLGHNYTSKVTAPTCTAQGYTTHTCSRCSDSYKDTYTAATGHSYTSSGSCSKCGAGCSHSYTSTVTKAATCTATGTRKYTCSKCSHSYTETIAKTPHTYAAATCTAPQTCTACGTTSGSALGHSYTSKVTAPTCTAGGYTTYTCSKCGDSYTGNNTSAAGHSWVSTGKCSTCGTACSHDWNCSTCKTCGYKRDFYLFGYINGANYACEGDSANLGSYKFTSNKLTVTFTSDSYVAVKTSDNASWYMTNGWQGEVTSVTLYNTTSLNNADKLYVPGGIKVTFTITENSNDTLTLKYSVTTSSCQHLTHSTSGVCTACGAAVDHSWSNGNCTVCGKTCSHSSHDTSGKCTTCGYAVGHSWASTGKCSVCNLSCTHKWSSGTCSTCGMTCSHSSHDTSGKCTTCGSTVSHSYTAKVTDPTCTTGGYTTYTCSVCSHSYKDSYTDAKGHSWNASTGKCSTCGTACSHDWNCSTCKTCGYKRDFYLFGYINGANYACEEDFANLGSYKFTSNKLTVTFTSDSYVAVKTSDNASWYMTDGYDASATSATLFNTATGIASPDKVYVPGGIQVTFTITENSNDTLTLKYSVTTSSCQHLTHSTDGVCTACGKTVDHSWSSGECSVCGKTCSHSSHDTSGKCTTCGMAVDHSYTSEETTAATCTTDGVRTYTCSKCGDTYTETISALGHEMVNGICSVCGYSTISTYNVTFSGTNVTSNGASTANDSANYTATLTPASGYHLPASITVKSGSTTLTSGTDYSYNSSTGALTINASAISGDIAITAEAEQDYYIVVGTENLTGSAWDTSATNNRMTKNADGTYSITYNNVAADYYEIKAVKNGSYDAGQWPYSGNKSFTVSKTSTVTVTLNLTTNELTVDVVPVVNSYNVTFTGTNVTSNGASTANDAENYTATLTPASGYQLPASITVKSGNTTLTSVTHYSYNSSTGALTINASAISGDITITAAAKQDYYIVVGTENLTGSDWDTTDTDNLMTQNADGTYSITYNNVEAGSYAVKAVKNGSYDNGQWPYSGNKSFTVDETSKVIVTLNLTANELIVDVISLVSHYEVTFNGTNVTSNGSVAADNEKDYSATLTVSVGYKLPSAITVKVGDSTLSSGDYTYNSSTGALTIPASRITGDITITAVAEESVYMVVGSTGLTGSDWDTTDTDNLMTKNADGTYTIVYSAVPAGTHKFKITENGDWKWPAEDYVLNTKSTSKVTITYNPTTGEGDVKVESVYVPTGKIDLPANQVYYATVDLVDYLNNNRVENNQVKGYFTDNQGEWTGEEDAVFSYMNHLVSQQGNYTYPLYFGPLHYIKSRYSKVVGSTAWENLSNWSTAANVAFGIKNDGVNINGSGVAQGLVRNTLDANGNLVDPSTNTPLLYFNQEAAESWTNNGHKVMAYYPNLQFPFVMSYDAKTRVTTYSYDSATDYAVYYDYTNSQLYASNTHVKDYKDNTGFYPLNAPTDADNQVNNGFGAKFTIDFTVGEDGYLINRDENGVIISKEPVTFEFTGDDDVWVFIDGVLVLDMGGAHAKANGKINFATREATVSNAASVGNSYKITSGTTYQQSTYSGKNLENYIYDGYMERATPDTGDVSATFESLGLDFDYGSVHTMTVFYMERGMFESNFSMEFTMIPVPSGLTLSKNLNDSEINKGLLNTISRADDLSFTLEATSPSSTSVAFSKYTLLDKYTGYSLVKNITGTTSGRTYSAAIDGINNYVYASSFVNSNGEDAFIPGTSFTITETTKGIFTYTGTSWVIYDANNGYINITDSVKTTDNTSSNIAKFTMGTEGSATAYSYAVSFINKLALGNLQVVKNVSDASLNGVEFTFKVYIDLDGSRDNFSPSLYPGLVYTVDGTTYTSTDGTIIVPGGKTAVISGLPAGATYQVDEVIPSDAPWHQVSKSGDSGSITANGTASAEFTNAVNVIVENKTIYVEAGKATDYTISYNGQIVDITDLTPGDGITATDNGDCIQVTGQDPDKQCTLTYEGRLEDGTIISGSITVYTFRAMNKVYVFDFGLSSNLADTTYGYGLFQQNYLFNQYASGESAALYAITGNGNTQTSITYTQGAAIQADGESSAVTFRPTAFMSKVETYSYTVHITASGETFEAGNPETGCAVTGTIEVMPANSVYYEDNFNIGGSDASEKFIYSNSDKAPTTAPEGSQSNDQSSNYGYDDAYLGDYRDSNDSATVLDHMEYTYFTFTGTGFDLDSRTTAGTAGMAVYVFKDTHKQEYLDYVTDLEYKGTLPSQPVDMVFVNNFYANGDLYQVPVVSVRLDECATYTVYIQCLSTSYASSVVIDGVRIYKPLKDTQYYASSEQNVIFSELRQLLNSNRGDGSNEVNDSKDILHLAGIADRELFVGTGKQSVVAEALIENPKLGTSVTTSADLNTVYKQGPNNEMYLPKNLGVMFTYSVTDSDWTLQLGAKAVTATNDAKSISIYVRVAGSDAVNEVVKITLSTATDMYYDLSQYLGAYSEQGKTYELFIISNSAASNNEFVSLTTVKYAGATLG